METEKVIRYMYLLLLTIRITAITGREAVSKVFLKPLTHIVPYKEHIFAADSSTIYVLDDNLEFQEAIVTCNENKLECNNVLKVFLVNNQSDTLVICGSGNNGRCQVRHATQPGNILKDSSVLGTKDTIVSYDDNIPAVATLMTNGKLLIAVTYGRGLAQRVQQDGYSARSIFKYSYTISLRSLEGTSAFKAEKYLSVELQNLTDYLIFYKATLEVGDFIYFVTNQKKYVGATEYVSKLARFCKRDVMADNPTKSFNSFVDFEISCETYGKTFNLIQDIRFVKIDAAFIVLGIFASGDDPQRLAGDSAICFATISDINDIIRASKTQFATCRDKLSKETRYFPKLLTNCLENLEVDPNACDEGERFLFFNYVIGVTSLRMNHWYTANADQGYMTKLFSRVLDGEILDIHIGTSTGRVITLNVPWESFTLYHETTIIVHDGFPIINIFEDASSKSLIVASERKIVKYLDADCSEFTTCINTMQRRNPLCGWCLYEERATRKSKCSSEDSIWLPSYMSCVSLMPHPTEQYVYSLGAKVVLELHHYSPTVENVTYTCLFSSAYIDDYSSPVVHTVGGLVCATPNVARRGYVLLTLFGTVNGTTVTIASSQYLYFDCSQYSSCFTCTRRRNCAWYPEANLCIREVHIRDLNIIKQEYSCPRMLQGQHVYLSTTGTIKPLFWNASNLDRNINGSYTCTLDAQEYVAIKLGKNSLYCSVKIVIPNNDDSENRTIFIMYEKNGLKTVLHDYSITVTEYRCEEVGKDCSQCLSLNTSRYNCKWCELQKACKANEFVCPDTIECPAPTITRISPNDGPYTGGTVITLEGRNLGRTLQDIKTVTVAGEICDVDFQDGISYTPVTGDYLYQVPKRIICTTRKLAMSMWPLYLDNPGNISIQMFAANLTYENAFTYKTSYITDINPRQGPISGITLVTLSGEQLAVGNRNVKVMYNNLPFENCAVRSSVSRSVIICQTPLTVGSMTQISLFLDNFTNEVFSTPLVFEKLADPIIKNVYPMKCTLSGGSRVTVVGERLTNANKATLTAVYAGTASEAGCQIISTNQMLCEVPEAGQQLRKDTEAIVKQDAMWEKSTFIGCRRCNLVNMVFDMDRVKYDFTLQYYIDPVFNSVGDNTGEHGYTILKHNTLVITGSHINLAVGKDDIIVTVGVEICVVVNVTADTVVCLAPGNPSSPGIPGPLYPVNVSVGNLQVHIGYVKYQAHELPQSSEEHTKTILIVFGCTLLVIAGIGLIFGVRKCMKVQKKTATLTLQLADMEMKLMKECTEVNTLKRSMNDARNKSPHMYITPASSETNYIMPIPDHYEEIDQLDDDETDESDIGKIGNPTCHTYPRKSTEYIYSEIVD